MTIDAYLAALRDRLPWLGRRRALAEAREHLRDSAARHRAAGLEPDAAEEAAIQGFGDVVVVARRFAAESAVLETRVATAVALAAVASFVFPLYVVPENTLPPAEWAEKPRDIVLLQVITVALWAVAGVFAAASALLAWTRWSRFAAPVVRVVPFAIAASMAVSAALVVRWLGEGPMSAWWPVLGAPLALGCLLVCATTAGWANSRRRRIAQN